MGSQRTNRNKKCFDKTSADMRRANYPLQFPCTENRKALDDLFASSTSHLFQAALRILLNTEDAEDAVQDSLLRAFRKLHQFDGRARFSTWLHRIAINSSLMGLRKRKYRRELPLEPMFEGAELVAPAIDPASDEPSPEEQCAQEEERRIVSEALLKLPGKFRTAIELCILEGLPIKDAARRLGVPVSTMKARLFRARRALKTTVLRGRSVRRAFQTAQAVARWPKSENSAGDMESLPAA